MCYAPPVENQAQKGQDILLTINARRTSAAMRNLAREPAALRGLGPDAEEEAAETAASVEELTKGNL